METLQKQGQLKKMSRTGKNIRSREVAPDPIYQNAIVSRLVNRLIKDGKKMPAQKQVYGAFEIIKEKTKKEPLDVFLQALENIKPVMEVRPRRIGGAAYQVPVPVKGERRTSLSIRWLVNNARARSNKEYHHFSEKLAAEILDALNNTGGAIKKKTDVHKMAEANKAFAHFRW